MEIRQRPYTNFTDLYRMGRLIRSAYAAASHWNAWSAARFDIWAQRRIADELVFGRRDWHADIALWVDELGNLLGATAFEDPHCGFMLNQPGDILPRETMLDWLEARYATRPSAGRALEIEAVDANTSLETLLRSRGYTRQDGHMRHRIKELACHPPETVRLPEGYRIKTLECPQDQSERISAAHTVFNFLDDFEVAKIVNQAPSYLPELDLLVIAPGGQIAAFATLWVDWRNSIAEFEPVGTLPAHQKRGLGSALLAEACIRLRALGVRRAAVHSWSGSEGANKLYESAGLKVVQNCHSWYQPA